MRPEEAQLLDDAPVALVATDDLGRIAHMNAAARRLFGWEDRDPLGAPLTELMPARMRGQHLEGFTHYRATHASRLMGRTVRVPALRGDGEEFEIDLTLRTFRRPDGSLLTLANIERAGATAVPSKDLLVLETKFQRRLYELV